MHYSLHPESEISAELYFRLRSAGHDVHLEVQVPSLGHRSGMMRVDLAILVAFETLLNALQTPSPVTSEAKSEITE